MKTNLDPRPGDPFPLTTHLLQKITELERENAALREALMECKDTLVEYVHGDIENPARMNSTLNIVRAAIDAARKDKP